MGGAVHSAGGLLREPKDALQSADADAGVVCNFVGFEGQRKVTDECLLCWRGIQLNMSYCIRSYCINLILHRNFIKSN